MRRLEERVPARLAFNVQGMPEGYNRSAAVQRRTPPEVEEWRKAIGLSFREACGYQAPFFPFGEYLGRVAVSVSFYGSRSDVDNLAKEVLDGLKGWAYQDDAQVISIAASVPNRQLGPGGKPLKPKENNGAAVVVAFLGP